MEGTGRLKEPSTSVATAFLSTFEPLRKLLRRLFCSTPRGPIETSRNTSVCVLNAHTSVALHILGRKAFIFGSAEIPSNSVLANVIDHQLIAKFGTPHQEL